MNSAEKNNPLKNSNISLISKTNNNDLIRTGFNINNNKLNHTQVKSPGSNINIKLNINSEIINNNFKIGKDDCRTAISSAQSSFKDYVSPKVKLKQADSKEKVN
jgi:hypothetical protein